MNTSSKNQEAKKKALKVGQCFLMHVNVVRVLLDCIVII